jgi:hypothetical protein
MLALKVSGWPQPMMTGHLGSSDALSLVPGCLKLIRT